MKSKIIIIALACSTAFLASCGGDHTTSGGKDTVSNRFGAKDSSNANIDTSKSTSSDNSASGGTKALDTTKKKDTTKK